MMGCIKNLKGFWDLNISAVKYELYFERLLQWAFPNQVKPIGSFPFLHIVAELAFWWGRHFQWTLATTMFPDFHCYFQACWPHWPCQEQVCQNNKHFCLDTRIRWMIGNSNIIQGWTLNRVRILLAEACL